MIPYSKQHIFKKDIQFVNKALKSNFLTQGPYLKKFENRIKKFVGCKYSLGFNSATSALHSACFSIGIKPTDIVWTSPISFVASANCAKYFNAKIDFVDIDINTFNISIEKLKKKLKKCKKNKLPKAIIIVHMAGNPVDMDTIKQLSNRYNFKIIEDASHALGSKFKNNKIGACKNSDICIFSFHPVKTITTAEGGILTTNNKKFFEKAASFREHGIVRDKKKFKNKKFKLPTHYEQHYLGYNFRLSELHSALGISQLDNINKILIRRNENHKYYEKILKKFKVKFQNVKKENYSSYHLSIILLKPEKRNKLFNDLLKKNIYVNLHYIPIYRHPFYKSFGYKISNYPNSESYYKQAISIPNFFNLKKFQIKKVSEIIKKHT